MTSFRFLPLSLLAATLGTSATLQAWDPEGHRIVNQIALAGLPAEFPAFVRIPAYQERIAFLSGEPDRWRNTADLPLKQANGLDHYLDLEQLPLAGIDPLKVPSLRYEFALQFATGRAAHLDKFPKIDPEKNADHSREWPGFLPWAITENYGKLKSAFSYLKAYEELGTAEEVANAKADIIYYMGLLGHYVGDGSQPLHLTEHNNGWVGDNPEGFTKWPGFHAWVDGGLIEKASIKLAEFTPKITTAKPLDLSPQADGRDPVFAAVMGYAIESSRLVEPLYRLEKDGKLFHHKEEKVVPEGREFIEARLLAGGNMLSTLWVTAWRNTTPDTFLHTKLLKRKAAAAAAKESEEKPAEKPAAK